MDISKIESEVEQDETGVAVTIYQKNGEAYKAPDGSDCTITVLGEDAKQVRRASEVNQRRMLRSRTAKVEPADVRRNRVDYATAAVSTWSGWEIGGKTAECSPENVKALLKSDHILRQVEQAVSSHADFFVSNSSS